MDQDYTLIKQLASGEPVAATAERLEFLEALGLPVQVDNDWLRLIAVPELFDPDQMGAQISEDAQQHLRMVDIHWSLDSTNTFLMARSGQQDFHGMVCLAEQQTAGRGRRGRQWISPFGKNIYCSLGWLMPRAMSIDGLSLAVGVAVAGAIEEVGGPQVKLKWPNDILLGDGDGKVAGILVEMGRPADNIPLVIGVGINLQLSDRDAAKIDQPWAVVRQVSRNILAARLISRLVLTLNEFAEGGFAVFRQRWQALDAYADKPVNIIQGDQTTSGIARGVSDLGHLRLELEAGVVEVNAGEVSLRPVVPS